MTSKSRYPFLDRFLHGLAFNHIGMQKVLADMEDVLYAKRFQAIPIDRPVFVTSLPRAGTTFFLELFSQTGRFAVHTYREMPFLLLPLLWHAISRSFHVSGTVLERAHGDGMTIGYDSVEAFEEILWHAFWPEKYLPDRIVPWRAGESDAEGEFAPFLHNHIRKLIALKGGAGREPKRYLSKNNANIARIPKLLELFPDAVVIVPFRSPVNHVSSMLRQHANFLKLHGEDPFARKYMKDLGHFDFGANLRPVNFAGWLDGVPFLTALTADFWLRYWRETFTCLLTHHSEQLVFISYENSCRHPMETLEPLCSRLGIDQEVDPGALAARFRQPHMYDPHDLQADPPLLESALALHRELLAVSINQPARVSPI